MDKNEVIHIIGQLGFDSMYSTNGSGKSTYLFDENLSIEIQEKVDYYTSWYGNHPHTYMVKFIWFRTNLVTFTLDSLTPVDIIHITDRMMEVYRGGNIGSPAMNRFIKYEKAKTPVLRSIKRDLQIQVVLLSERGDSVL